MKNKIITLIKIIFAATLIIWMVKSDKLNFSTLNILFIKPELLLYTIIYWVSIPVLLAAFRWHVLLKIFNINVKFFELLKLHLTSLFFNACLPGAFGGDVMKVYYIVSNKKQIASGLTTILLDRIFGLIALVLIGTVFIWQTSTNELIIDISKYTFTALTICFLTAIAFRTKMIKLSQNIINKMPVKIKEKLASLNKSIEKYLMELKPNITVLLISLIIHTAVIMYFYYLTNSFDINSIKIHEMATIFAIGGILIAIPISPSGIGVGHVGFAYLFNIYGVENGADIFNVFVISQIALNFTGIIPYMFINKQKMTTIN